MKSFAILFSVSIKSNSTSWPSDKVLYPFDFIAEYVSKEDVERIIIGKPLQTNGEYSENMKRVEPFYNRLKKLYPSIIIEYFDERYTSVLAHQAILESGIKKKDRQNKALVDKISASIILEGYMEHLRFTNEHNN